MRDWDARLYDERHSFVWKRAASLIDALAPRPGERILDLGCGTGHLTAQIAACGAEVVGLDNAPSMVEQARRAYPALRFILADAASFALPEPLDAVFSNAALHWMRPPEAVAGRVAAALRPGGRFVAEFGGRGNVAQVIAALRRARAAVRGEAERDLNPWYFPSLAEHASLLEHSGLAVTDAALYDRPTPLEGGEAGLRGWLAMFGGPLLDGLDDDERAAVARRTEELLRPALLRDGVWHADYRRLRIVATKGGGGR